MTVAVKVFCTKFFRNLWCPEFIMASTKDSACSAGLSTDYHGEKLIYPAANRNKDPILQILKGLLPEPANSEPDMSFLEIASGSGQHISHFAPHFPRIIFQPSEVNNSFFGSINYYIKNCSTKNIKPPIILDIRKDFINYGFDKDCFNFIYNANMMHISLYECTEGLFRNAGIYLLRGGYLICYGPFSENGVISPESNVAFDATLRAQHPEWGLRDIVSLNEMAVKNGLLFEQQYSMPSNNKILVFKKIGI